MEIKCTEIKFSYKLNVYNLSFEESLSTVKTNNSSPLSNDSIQYSFFSSIPKSSFILSDLSLKSILTEENFEFDFEKVYWCSRLQKERDRLL